MAVALTLSASSAAAQRILDGDTLHVDGVRVRLVGIDAPEKGQRCGTAPRAYDCGAAAAEALRVYIAGRAVHCAEEGRDRYGRSLATCAAEGHDLGAYMVRQGWAVAYVSFDTRYLADEIAARKARRGIWAGEFQLPEAYRAALRAQR